MSKVKTPEQLQGLLVDRRAYEASLVVRQAETATKLASVREQIERLEVTLGLAGQVTA